MDFVKKNWKLVIVYGILFLAIIACSVVLVTKCIRDNRPNGTTVIDASTLEEKISHKEDFILVVGQYDCSACQLFNDTLREYTSDGRVVYYFYADNENDIHLDKAISTIKKKLVELPKERGITLLLTPTTIFVEDGIFKDAYQGHVKVSDTDEYEEFTKIVEGQYVKRKTILTLEELIEKIQSGEEFIFTIGQTTCGHCMTFESTIHRYLQEGNDWYYVYVDQEDSTGVIELYTQVILAVPEDREISYYTPLSVYVKEGVYIDAYMGTIDTYNDDQYNKFKDLLSGLYVGEAYPFE
jgi:predicted bacteriocin transport accessory protein